MPDGAPQVQTPDAAPRLTDTMLDWVHRFTNIDVRAGAGGGSAQGAGGAGAPPTPAENRADLERRIRVSGQIYDRAGTAAADDMVGAKDKLSGAEQKIGKVVIDDGRSQTILANGGKTTMDIAASGKPSQTIFDEKGITTSNKTTISAARIGKDGKAEEWSNTQSSSTNIGLGNVSKTSGSSTTIEGNGVKATAAGQTTKSMDIVKGEASRTTSTSNEYKDAAGTLTKTNDKSTTTIGMSGLSNVHEETKQVDKKVDGQVVKQFDSTSTTQAFTRGAGQAGYGYSTTTKSGQMKDGVEPAAQFMDKGTETTTKGGVGLVSDDKGAGLGANAGRSDKRLLGDGMSLSRDFGGGAKIQSLVKEVGNSDPPKFQITTTISFDISMGATGAKEAGRPEALAKDAGPETSTKAPLAKGTGSLGVSGSFGGAASFKRDLTEKEAHAYLECIKANGRGSKLPEHRILAEGVKNKAEKAQKLWAAINGSAEQVMDLKPGEEIESSMQAAGGVKAGVKGGMIAAEGSVSKSHRCGVKKVGMPGDMVQVTVTVDDSLDVAGSLSVSQGIVTGTGTGTHSDGKGRTIVFMLDKLDRKNPGQKNPDIASQLRMLDSVSSPEGLDKIATEHPELVATNTKRESESGSLGVTISAGAPVPALGNMVQVNATGKGSYTGEETRDGKGNVISTKHVGTSQVEASAAVGSDMKAKSGDTGAYTGETQLDPVTGKVIAKGKIADDHRGFSLKKTENNLIDALENPVGALLNPSKLLGEMVNQKALDLDDNDTAAICLAALDKQKWDGEVSGHRQDEWIETGAKIRALLTVKDGKIVDANKPAIQKVLALWSKAKDGGRTDALSNVLRPEDGGGNAPIRGKASKWPDGTERYQAMWDALIATNPLDAARAKAKTDAKAAQTDIDAYHDKLTSFRKDMEFHEDQWAAMKAAYAEMMGHIVTRVRDTRKLEADLTKLLSAGTPAPKVGNGGKSGDPEAQAREQNKAQAGFRTEFQANMEVIETHFKTVFETLWKYEQHLSGKGDQLDKEFIRSSMKDTRYELKSWEQTYTETYKIWEQLKPLHFLEEDEDPEQIKKMKEALEKVHPHGAHERFGKFEPDLQRQLRA